MKISELRKMIKDLPDDWDVMYHASDHGCCHAHYPSDWNYIGPYGWCYIDNEHKAIVMNPGDDYDGRKPK